MPESGFGVPTEDWSKLKRAKAALADALRSKIAADEPGRDEAEVENDRDPDEAEPSRRPG